MKQRAGRIVASSALQVDATGACSARRSLLWLVYFSPAIRLRTMGRNTNNASTAAMMSKIAEM